MNKESYIKHRYRKVEGRSGNKSEINAVCFVIYGKSYCDC